MFALGRENVLPAALGHTGTANIAVAASLCQSVTGLAVITGYAVTGLDPMTRLFFWGGVTGGLGVLLLLTATAIAVIAYFARHPSDETLWRRLAAPALAAVLLMAIVVLAVRHYALLLGVPPGDPAAWALPASYGIAAAAGLAWAVILKIRRPGVYQVIGLGAHAVTGQHAPASVQAPR